jgi:hypothetical protein
MVCRGELRYAVEGRKFNPARVAGQISRGSARRMLVIALERSPCRASPGHTQGTASLVVAGLDGLMLAARVMVRDACSGARSIVPRFGAVSMKGPDL